MEYKIGDIIRVKSYNELKKNKEWLIWYNEAVRDGDYWINMLNNSYKILKIDLDTYYLDAKPPRNQVPWFEFEVTFPNNYTIYGEKV